MAIASLRPSPPVEALQPLIRLLDDPDTRMVGGATIGLMRLPPSVPAAEDAVRQFLAREKRPDRLLAAVYGIGEAGRAQAGTVAAVSGYLRHRDSRLGIGSALTLEKLGPNASGALPVLQGLAADTTLEEERRNAAQRAITAITRAR